MSKRKNSSSNERSKDMKRIIASPTSLVLEDLRKVDPWSPEIGEMKPRGLWYAFGDAWLDWSKENMPELYATYKYLYEIELHTPQRLDGEYNYRTTVLELIPDDDMKKFRYRYCDAETCTTIWAEVAEKYAGIEIPVWFDGLKHREFYGWDVPSGCIWNPKAIKAIKLIKGPDPDDSNSAVARDISSTDEEDNKPKRIIASPTLIENVREVSALNPDYHNMKPNGLWYSFDDTWLEWSKENRPDLYKSYKYLYEIKLHEVRGLDDTPKHPQDEPPWPKPLNPDTTVLELGPGEQWWFRHTFCKLQDRKDTWDIQKTIFKACEICKKHLRADCRACAEKIMAVENYKPQWDLCAEEYAGIEISAEIEAAENKYFTGWDVPSGVIWNPKAIKEIKLVREL